jgi:hypothetical protein
VGGIVAGVIVSAATASMTASLLYGVQPHDLLVFLAVPLLLFAIALLGQLPSSEARDEGGPHVCPSTRHEFVGFRSNTLRQ